MNGASEPNLIDSFGEYIFAWDFSSPPAVLFLLIAAAYTIGTIQLAMRSETDSSFWSKVGTTYFAFALLAFALAGLFFVPSSIENNGLTTLKPVFSELPLLDWLAVFPVVRDFCVPLLALLFFATDFESLLNNTSSKPFESLLGIFSCWWFPSPLGFEPAKT